MVGGSDFLHTITVAGRPYYADHGTIPWENKDLSEPYFNNSSVYREMKPCIVRSGKQEQRNYQCNVKCQSNFYSPIWSGQCVP